MGKLNVEFISDFEPLDEIMSNALLTQLMVQITQIGIRVDSLDSVDCSKIKKETSNVKEN